jgi:hypothetical protein
LSADPPASFDCNNNNNGFLWTVPPSPSTGTGPPSYAVPAVATNLPASGDLCSCSPLQYDFILSLDQDCSVDDLFDNAGIGATLCTADAAGGGASSITITSVQFLELDKKLVTINNDDTYFTTTLVNGDSISFKSITNELSADAALGDQLDYVPGWVQLTIRGTMDNGSGGIVDVSNRIMWSFTNSCGEGNVTVESGDGIGWITIVSLLSVLSASSLVQYLSDIDVFSRLLGWYYRCTPRVLPFQCANHHHNRRGGDCKFNKCSSCKY